MVRFPAEAKNILLATVNSQDRAFLEEILRSDYNVMLANDGEQVLNILLEYGNNISPLFRKLMASRLFKNLEARSENSRFRLW